MNKIIDQFHPIIDSRGNLKEIQLSELFSKYGNGVSQIIRTQNGLYSKLNQRLVTDGNVNLFNAVDSVNNDLISAFQATEKTNCRQAIIAEIFGPEGIIIQSSIKVVHVLEMKNISIQNIKKDSLYLEAIYQHQTFEDFINWLCNDFYKGKIHRTHLDSLLYRKIKLTDN